MPSSSDQTRVGRTLTLGGGAEYSVEGRDIELSVSPKDIRTSPYDLCANRSDRRQSRQGTDGSNPLPSSGESSANLIFGDESIDDFGISPNCPADPRERSVSAPRICPSRPAAICESRLGSSEGLPSENHPGIMHGGAHALSGECGACRRVADRRRFGQSRLFGAAVGTHHL